jgi:hypothetical protein
VPTDVETTLAALAYYDIRHIVLHTDRLSDEREACALALVEEHLKLTPFAVNGPVRAYAVPTVPPQPFVFLGDGWHAPERDAARTWRWMKDRGEVYIVNPDDEQRRLLLDLRLESLETPRPLTLLFEERHIGVLEVTPDISRSYRVLLHVPPGEHELRMLAPATLDPDPTAPRRLSIAVMAITVVPPDDDAAPLVRR